MIENFEKLVLTLQKIADDASGLPGIFMSKDIEGGRVFIKETALGDWVCLIDEGPDDENQTDGRGDTTYEAAAMALWNWLRRRSAKKNEGGNVVFLNLMDGTVYSSEDKKTNKGEERW